uniref:Uncharacterized protein n=1 Tax=Populus alba TaxID=43335 RepID=A0A4U5PN70_POPAL|nr:hypothetical protein D5086_0000200970 [Populus alba]
MGFFFVIPCINLVVMRGTGEEDGGGVGGHNSGRILESGVSSELLGEYELVLWSGKGDDGVTEWLEEQVGEGVEVVMIAGGKTSFEMTFVEEEFVSRLKCGGFLFALRLNHTMSDGQGLVQFMAAVAEIARGANAPSVPPVWERHVLHSVGLETCRT